MFTALEILPSCIECQYIPEEHEEDIKDTENLLRHEIEQIKGD